MTRALSKSQPSMVITQGSNSAPQLLQALNIEKCYGGQVALEGVRLSVQPGEVWAITGPSGSGKSTLLHVLSGIVVPDSGEVWYGEERVDTATDTRRSVLRRSVFGLVFQFGNLIPELTAAENVALPLWLAKGVSRQEASDFARSVLEEVGIGGLANRLPGTLSGGEAQRVAVARAIAPRPRVLFADEPTGSLDSIAGAMVMDLLADLVQYYGMTIVLVTHDAAIAARATRQARLFDGRLTLDS